MPASPRPVRLRLIHDGVQPGPTLHEPLRFGLQDTAGNVHPGLTEPGQARGFDLTLTVQEGDAGRPVFRGAFAHGPPATRFLYLSWKRVGLHAHPWGWRIKIPLSGIGWQDITAAEPPGRCLTADVVGRRPHTSDRVSWRVETTDREVELV